MKKALALFFTTNLLVAHMHPIEAMKSLPKHERVPLEIMVFDVGQGNCTYVKHPTEAHMLIDAGSAKLPAYHTGSTKTVKEKIIKHIVMHILQAKPPRVAIVVSHAHADHYGWIPAIAKKLLENKIPITLLLGGTASDYKTDAYKALNEIKVKVGGTYVSDYPRDTLSELKKRLPSYCHVEAACIDGPAHNPNCRSIVLTIDNFLIVPGDATGHTTEAIAATKKPAIIEGTAQAFPRGVIVAHHGSATEESNSKKFLANASPRFALISCGDRYNLPEGPVIETLIETLENKEAVTPHMLTYCQEFTALDTDRFRPYLRYANGYTTAVTDYAIYSTQDMRDILISTRPDSTMVLSFPDDPIRAINMRDCVVKSIKTPPFTAITEIDIPHNNLQDPDLLTINTLPQTLETFNLTGNTLQPETIRHFLRLLSDHSIPIKLGVKDVGFCAGHFESILRNDKRVGPLLRTWLFFCVVEKEGEVGPNRRLERIDFSIGLPKNEMEDPINGIYVPAYVVSKVIAGMKNAYMLVFSCNKESYIEDLRKIELLC